MREKIISHDGVPCCPFILDPEGPTLLSLLTEFVITGLAVCIFIPIFHKHVCKVNFFGHVWRNSFLEKNIGRLDFADGLEWFYGDWISLFD